MKEIIYLIFLISVSINSYGQKFEVPDSVLNNVKSKQFEYTYKAEFKKIIANLF